MEAAMLPRRHLLFALPLIVFARSLSLADEPAGVDVLEKKGLTRSGRFFVIQAETTVLEKWKATRVILADHAATIRRKDEADFATRRRAGLDDRRAELQRNLDELNQRINEQGFQPGNGRLGGFGQGTYATQLIAQRDMLRMSLSEVNSAQQFLKAESSPDPKNLEAESQKSLEAARAALSGVRAAVNSALKEYDGLDADASVRAALLGLEKQKLGTFKLGPSPAFKTAVKALESAERTVLAKRTGTAPRKKGRSSR
jgi:hypothetical protein